MLTFKRDRTLADFVTDLAAMPLLHQPGEVWEYSWGVDVLARVVEVVSGQPFDQFLEGRLFKPLGMVDTGFFVPEDKLGRLVDPVPGGWPPLWNMTTPTRLFSGGGGLVGTAGDYLRFCQMLLNGGELDGVRILKASTVRQMTTDALEPGTRFAGVQGAFLGPLFGTSWGLGFAIRVNPEFSLLPGAVGSFSWSGVWGEYFWIDPVEKLIGVQLIHLALKDNSGQFRNAFRHLTYAALRVPEQAAPAASPAVSAGDPVGLCRQIRFRAVAQRARQASASMGFRRGRRWKSGWSTERPLSACPTSAGRRRRPGCSRAIKSSPSTISR